MEGCLDWSYVPGEMCAKFKHGRSPIRHTIESLYTRNLICMATTMLKHHLPEKSAEVNYGNFSTSYSLHLETGRFVIEPVLLRKFEDVEEFILINHQKALKNYWTVCGSVPVVRVSFSIRCEVQSLRFESAVCWLKSKHILEDPHLVGLDFEFK